MLKMVENMCELPDAQKLSLIWRLGPMRIETWDSRAGEEVSELKTGFVELNGAYFCGSNKDDRSRV